MVLATLVALACGDTPSPATPTPSPTPTQPPPTPTPEPDRPSLDELDAANVAYVRAICIAGAFYEQRARAAGVAITAAQGPEGDFETDVSGLLGPLRDLFDAMGMAAPPAFIAAHHALIHAKADDLEGLAEEMVDRARRQGKSVFEEDNLLFELDRPLAPPLFYEDLWEQRNLLAWTGLGVPECRDSRVLHWYLDVPSPTRPVERERPPLDAIDAADVAYLRDVCAAAGRYAWMAHDVAIGMEAEQGVEDDLDVSVHDLLPLLEELFDALRAATPPADLAAYHAAALAGAEDLSGLAEELVDLALDGMDDGFVADDLASELLAVLAPAQERGDTALEARRRLAWAAGGLPECDDSAVLEAYLGFVEPLPPP